jgi:hypothetical protein
VTTPSEAGTGAGALVTVVIDNYEYARYVGAAIDSALAQTWPHVEVVVVDDGSTDESAEVIGSYGDRIRAVFQANGGQASAFNTGVAVSSGDVVLFVDADDVMQPDSAERAVRALASAPGSTMAQFRMLTVDAELRPLGTTVPPAYVALADGDVAVEVCRWTTGSSFAPNGAAAFRRSTLDMLFPLPAEELRQGADFYMLRGAALLGPVVGVDETSTWYRSHGANDSHLSTLDLAGVRRALDRQLRYGRVLAAFGRRVGAPPVLDPLQAPDPLFLTQRLVSRRLEPDAHPFAADTPLRLAAAGVRAAATRRDIRPLPRLLHAVWFVLMALAPRPAARLLATWLMLPLSRKSPVARLSALLAGVRRRVG